MFANQGRQFLSIGLLCASLLSGVSASNAQGKKNGEAPVSRYQQQSDELTEVAAAYRDGSEARCREGVKNGEPVAMLVLAERLLPPRNSNEKCPEAIEWLNRAAAKDFTPAIHRLGICHYFGIGTPENNEKAVACFRRASDAGYVSSLQKLGMCYDGGHGVEVDVQKAYRLLLKAAEAGEPEALFFIGVYYSEGVAVKQDQTEAVRWWTKSAEAGSLLAVNNLGVAYLEGKGTEVDKPKAITLFREGAAQGNSHCEYNLGRCYRDGIGVIQDYDTAEEWLDKAAAQKHKLAVVMLAELRSVRAAARAEARARLFGWQNSSPVSPDQPSDAEEAARRQMRDYQYQLGSGLPR